MQGKQGRHREMLHSSSHSRCGPRRGGVTVSGWENVQEEEVFPNLTEAVTLLVCLGFQGSACKGLFVGGMNVHVCTHRGQPPPWC